MLRKISFALVAATALGTAALAPTSASAWGHGRGVHAGRYHGGWVHRGFGWATGISAMAGRDGAITIRAAADNGGERSGPQWPGRFSRERAQIG